MTRVGAIHTPRGGIPRRQNQSLRLPASRVKIVGCVLGVLFGALLVRAIYLQVIKQDFLQGQGSARYSRTLTLEATRGMITDRNGEPLAISTPVQSIWASPADMDAVPVEKINALARLLDLKPEDIARKFADKRREFVYLKRQIRPELADEVVKLAIPGVSTQREYRRYYPAGEIMAQVVGYTGMDGRGQEGMELSRDKMLAGHAGSRHVIKDRRGHIVEDVAAIERPRDGQTLALSLDRRVQYLAYRELKAGMEASGAKAGGIVVLDAQTGETLALVNLPTYNPNNRWDLKPAEMRNRVLSDQYEPGSIMKPLVIAKAFDDHLIRAEQVFDTRSYTIGPALIKDTHLYPELDIGGILQKSSNVGASKIALLLQQKTMWQFFNDIGFGRRPQTGFPGEAAGHVRPWKTWRPIEQATMGYGHGISVSLIQMARAYTVFTNDGEMLPISFTKLDAPLPGKSIISAQTARTIRHMMIKVTEPGGTAPRAQVLGYHVAGKTGTALKLEGGRYVKKYVASFVGFAPATRPRLIVAVMFDEPGNERGMIYGGISAAPVFAKVMADGLRMLGVEPDAPTNNTLFPADVPLVKEET